MSNKPNETTVSYSELMLYRDLKTYNTLLDNAAKKFEDMSDVYRAPLDPEEEAKEDFDLMNLTWIVSYKELDESKDLLLDEKR